MQNQILVGDKLPFCKLNEVYSRYEQVVNFVCGEYLSSLVTREIGAGPFNIVFSGLEPDCIHSLEYLPDCLILNEKEVFSVTGAQIYHSEFSFAGVDATLLKHSIDSLKELFLPLRQKSLLAGALSGHTQRGLTGFEQILAKQFALAYEALLNRDFEQAAQGFKGRGNGLTPAGDDFNAGLLLGLLVREQTEKKELSKIRSCIYHISLGKNLLVNTFLLSAHNGWFNAGWQALLAALIGREGTIDSALLRILARGESSGADTLAGFVTAWDIKI